MLVYRPKNASFPRDQDPDYLRANQDAFKQSTKAVGLEADVSNTRTLKVLQFTFLTAEGVHPATAVGWFTDGLGFAIYHPEPGKCSRC